MKEQQPIKTIGLGELLNGVEKFFKEGYRLVIVTCLNAEGGFELTYSFDKDYKLESLRTTIKTGTVVPSISGIYWNAFIFENEIHDLFGINITGINIDYKGNLYKTTIKYPFTGGALKEVDSCQSKQ
jgi:ech hydrogenase subunit D